MYDTNSTAHRVAHDLTLHPETMRIIEACVYDEADGEYPAEVAVDFRNGSGLNIFDRADGAVKVQCSTHASGELMVAVFTSDPNVDDETNYASLLDRVVSIAHQTSHAVF